MMKTVNDVDLIKKCLDGDQDAFSELVSRYKNLIFSVILRMTNDSEEAKDLSQEVFIKIFRNLEKYNPEFKFSTWIIRITTNHIIDHRRKKRLNTVNIDEMLNEPRSDSTPESLLLSKEKNSKVSEALSELPEMYRLPVILYHQQGMSYKDISDALDEPLSKIKNRIFRARKMLRTKLEEKGGMDYEML